MLMAGGLRPCGGARLGHVDARGTAGAQPKGTRMHPCTHLCPAAITAVCSTQVAQMMRGVEIDGAQVVPEEISTLEESVRLRVVVAEGKKHEVGAEGGGEGFPVSDGWLLVEVWESHVGQ